MYSNRKGDRVVSEKLDVKGKTINQVMQWFYHNELVVNRRYQRKLVWTLKEKKLFIDSIVNKFPTPSIILVRCIDPKTSKEWYEIIDGLQRLNAIVSFVNGEFSIPYDGKQLYFDPQFIPTTHRMAIEGKLPQHDKSVLLPLGICNDIADFELPIVLTSQGADKVEQIFSRINSYGRKLSKHDLRQSCSTGKLPDLVRRISADIRGDGTYQDILLLQEMPFISLNNDDMGYGIDTNTVFWRKHDIIPFSNMRQSKDEEIVASLLGKILYGDSFTISSYNLDKMYNSDDMEDLNTDQHQNTFKIIIGQINDIFDTVNSNFSQYLFKRKNAPNKDIAFEILFMALYRLYVEGYVVEDFELVCKKLLETKDTVFSSLENKKRITHENRKNYTEALYNALKNSFVKHTVRESTEYEELLKKLLSLSKIESQLVEFKIGVTDLETGEFNPKVINKIAKTLAAMSNTITSDDVKGYLIIGIADNDLSYSNWKKRYKIVGNTYGNHIITGVLQEAINNSKSLDNYYKMICDALKIEPLNDHLREHILSNCKTISFMDKDLIIFSVSKQEVPSTYNDKVFIREGNSTVEKID